MKEFNILNYSIPDSWTYAYLEDISEIILGQSPPSSTYNEENIGLPFYQGKSEFGEIYPTPVKSCSVPKKIAEQGDVLISVRAPVGPTNICPDQSCIGRGLAAIRGLCGIEPHFILYLIRSFEHIIAGEGTGTTFKAITGKQLREFEVPVPPLNEQKRIVTKIEELFTRLDAGIQELSLTKEKLKIYRQSVLKNAFEGKLTEEWREAHKDEIQPAPVILKKVKNERKKVFGKKYKQPVQIETSELPHLPEGWTWTNVESLAQTIPHAIKAGPFGSSLKKAFYVPEGYKIYGQEQVIRNDPYYGDYFIDEDRFETLKSCKVKPGDILISLVGTIGKVLILPDDIEPGIINPRLVKFSLDKRIINSKFIKIYLESTAVRHFFSIASHGGTMDILNLTILKKLPISLPPLEEQNQIIGQIEQKFIIIDEIEKDIAKNMSRAQKLRQSILKKAFRGQLIPQDPNDEPAEKLLERIKAENEKQKPKRKTRKKSNPNKRGGYNE